MHTYMHMHALLYMYICIHTYTKVRATKYSAPPAHTDSAAPVVRYCATH